MPRFFKSAYLLFLVDDTIFVRDFSVENIINELSNNPDALGYSLRLGKNTNYCYSLASSQLVPSFQPISLFSSKFNWVNAELDFNYPLEISSSLYRLNTIIFLLIKNKYNNPNTLEAFLSRKSFLYIKNMPNLLCSNQSLAFSYPINKVQGIFNNRSGNNEEISAENLALLYEKGYRIDIECFSNYIPKSCHEEIELIFKNPYSKI